MINLFILVVIAICGIFMGISTYLLIGIKNDIKIIKQRLWYIEDVVADIYSTYSKTTDELLQDVDHLTQEVYYYAHTDVEDHVMMKLSRRIDRVTDGINDINGTLKRLEDRSVFTAPIMKEEL